MPLYILKVVGSSGEAILPPCSGLEITYLVRCAKCGGRAMEHGGTDGENDPGHAYEPQRYGTSIALLPQPNTVITLPDNGSAVYVMNEAGDTIQTYRWPEAARNAGQDGQVQFKSVTRGGA